MSKQVWGGVSASLAAALALTAYAANGDLDPTFDTDGIVITDFDVANHDQIQGLAIDGSDRIIAAGFRGSATNGNFAIARYNADGSLDTTFDTDGLVEQAFSATGDVGNAVAIDSNGKIVVAGTVAGRFGNSEIGVARFNADGSLDTTFDTDGLVTTDIGAIDQGYAMAVQADDKIVVAGAVDNVITVIRYNTDGSLDTTFDTDGIASGAAAQTARAMAIDGSGNIVVAGYTANTASADFILQRFTPAGALDTTFDADGTVTTDFGASKDLAYSVVVDGSGRIVAAGHSGGSFAIARYTSSGALDTTFDTDGLVTTDASAGNDIVYGLAIDGAGKIVAGGIFTSNFGIARYNEDGSLDTTFTPTGLTQADVAGGSMQDHAYAMMLDGNGFIVAGGRAFSSTTNKYNFALARFQASAVTAYDCGDAPDSYSTLVASSGPRHAVGSLFLGSLIDDESDGLPGITATGDDDDVSDDEDGVALGELRTGEMVDADITVSGGPGVLDAWVDFNADGDFGDAGEKIFDGTAVADGANALTFMVPAEAVIGDTYARFRLSSAGVTDPTGDAPDGEIEDYQVAVVMGDPGVLSFTASSVSVNEGDGTVTLNVQRVDGQAGEVSVEYSTRPGSATRGDFTATRGTLTWANGDTANKMIVIPLNNDTRIEDTEEFSVDLLQPVGAALGSPSTESVTIFDNDFIQIRPICDVLGPNSPYCNLPSMTE
jgi:uncharacterized delta-60 repeat protein